MAALRVLIAGGGVAGLEAALALRNLGGERVAVELLAPDRDFVNRPVTTRNAFAPLDIPRLPLERLGDHGIALHAAALAEVDPGRHRVRTSDGGLLHYDRLIVAVGGHPVPSVPGATHFAGPHDAGVIEHVLRVVTRDPERTLTFALPDSVTWPLPFYELALLSAADLARRGFASGRIRLVTHEGRPLELFGPTASDAVARLLLEAHVEVITVTDARTANDGGTLISVPEIKARAVAGLEPDPHGFLPVDAHGRVPGAEDVFAAGDVTDGPVKQGGLAAQQADAAALWIAADAGAPVDRTPPPPTLRAVLFTPDGHLHLRAPLGDPDRGEVSPAPLWHPAGKLAGRYLAGYLATGDPAAELVDRAPAIGRIVAR